LPNPKTQRKETVISPALTQKDLDGLIAKTRDIIVNLYIKCEEDFIKGLDLFEAIVEGQIMDTSRAQIKRLEATIQQSIAEPPSESVSDSDKPVEPGVEDERPERPGDGAVDKKDEADNAVAKSATAEASEATELAGIVEKLSEDATRVVADEEKAAVEPKPVADPKPVGDIKANQAGHQLPVHAAYYPPQPFFIPAAYPQPRLADEDDAQP